MSLNGVAPPNTPRFSGEPEGGAITGNRLFVATPGEGQTPTPFNAFNPFNPFNQIISSGTRALLRFR